MKIRTITCFTKLDRPAKEEALSADQLQRGCDFLIRAKETITKNGIDVQTCRLATNPFPEYLPVHAHKQPEDAWIETLCSVAVELEKKAASLGIEYLSMGPARVGEWEAYQAIPVALEATQNVFFSGMMTIQQDRGVSQGGSISLQAVRACAKIIQQAAWISPDGFTNLRFAALANVPGGAPFFPAGYQAGSPDISFGLGLEAADLAVAAARQASSLTEMRQLLIQSIEQHALSLSQICRRLENESEIHFAGLDFTLAPFPHQAISIGAALEQMGVSAIGMHGSLAGVAFLADTLDRAQFPRTGFNGVFFPVLEDSVLAQRAKEGLLGIKDLLLYAAVCGTGLDTVPISGDASVEQIYALLLDLAALAQRLDKPLTARLMPIPGKKAGDPTGFDFSFFANSRIMPLQTGAAEGLLGGNESFDLKRR